MNGRALWLITVFLLTLVSVADAQQAVKVPRIGYASTGDASSPGPLVEAFRRGLRELGYVDGKNILIEYRYAEGDTQRIPNHVRELVQLNVDVLVVPTQLAILAAKQATKSIPTVMVSSEDPVATGIVESLARPGGNITGVARLQRELSGKRLELLKEALPRITRVGLLRDVDSQTTAIGAKEYESAATALKLHIQPLAVRGSNLDLDSVFQPATMARIQSLITITNTTLFRQQKRIVELATKNQLPTMFEGNTWVESGGLMSYSTNDVEVFRRIATYVDKILKGTKPANLPVERPTNFEFTINLKTAKEIGVTIPPNVLARADKLIK